MNTHADVHGAHTRSSGATIIDGDPRRGGRRHEDDDGADRRAQVPRRVQHHRHAQEERPLEVALGDLGGGDRHEDDDGEDLRRQGRHEAAHDEGEDGRHEQQELDRPARVGQLGDDDDGRRAADEERQLLAARGRLRPTQVSPQTLSSTSRSRGYDRGRRSVLPPQSGRSPPPTGRTADSLSPWISEATTPPRTRPAPRPAVTSSGLWAPTYTRPAITPRVRTGGTSSQPDRQHRGDDAGDGGDEQHVTRREARAGRRHIAAAEDGVGLARARAAARRQRGGRARGAGSARSRA